MLDVDPRGRNRVGSVKLARHDNRGSRPIIKVCIICIREFRRQRDFRRSGDSAHKAEAREFRFAVEPADKLLSLGNGRRRGRIQRIAVRYDLRIAILRFVHKKRIGDKERLLGQDCAERLDGRFLRRLRADCRKQLEVGNDQRFSRDGNKLTVLVCDLPALDLLVLAERGSDLALVRFDLGDRIARRRGSFEERAVYMKLDRIGRSGLVGRNVPRMVSVVARRICASVAVFALFAARLGGRNIPRMISVVVRRLGARFAGFAHRAARLGGRNVPRMISVVVCLLRACFARFAHRAAKRRARCFLRHRVDGQQRNKQHYAQHQTDDLDQTRSLHGSILLGYMFRFAGPLFRRFLSRLHSYSAGYAYIIDKRNYFPVTFRDFFKLFFKEFLPKNSRVVPFLSVVGTNVTWWLRFCLCHAFFVPETSACVSSPLYLI